MHGTPGNPLVSIVIAAYQQPEYLNQALRSIAAQTYSAIEIVVVDDASGAEHTAKYELPCNARLIVHDKRSGIAAVTRNTGIEAARGEYIAFLDQDDLWLPEKLSWQVEQMQKRPDARLIFGHFQRIDTAGNPSDNLTSPPRLRRDLLRQIIRRNFIQCPSQVLISRTTLQEIGFFDPTIRGSADWELWIRAVAAGPIIADPRVMTLYRQHDQQWSHNHIMIRQGGARTMEKTASWIGTVRPDLRWQVRRRWARWLREVARAQFRSTQRDERAEALRTLRRGLKLWPLDVQGWSVGVCGLLHLPCPI